MHGFKLAATQKNGWPSDSQRRPYEHIYKTCKEEDCYILYLHSKGVKNKDEDQRTNIRDGVNFVLYFLLYRSKDVFHKLRNHDAIGCNLYNFSEWMKTDSRSTVKERFKNIKDTDAEDLYWKEFIADRDKSVDMNNHLRCWFALNFWWSKSDHINNIDYKFYDGYCGPEMWITKTGKMLEMKNSGRDHLFEPYRRSEYINSEPEYRLVTEVESCFTGVNNE